MFTGVAQMGSKLAEAKMGSTCVIRRKTGESTDANGVVSDVFTTIYSGKCGLRMADAQSNQVVAAGQSLETQSPTLSIPVAAAGSASVRPDDIATVTTPLDSFDSFVAIARIAGMHSQTHSTARRFPVEVTL